jgi:acyl-CoA thioesterase
VTEGESEDAQDADAEEEASYGDFPLKRYLGMELHGDDPGVGYAEIEIGPVHLNPNGVVHGAVLFALVDTAMGKSTMSVIDQPGAYCASIELSLRFIRPAVAGRLLATARVVKRGRNVVHLDADVVGDDSRLVASAAGTFAVLGQ